MPITTIVLHASAGRSALSSVRWLRKINLSYHYIIERDGTITKLVPVSKVAFHAGRSLGPNGRDVNSYSIGVCLANDNRGEAYPAAQVLALAELVYALAGKVESLRWLTTHYVISPDRKTDPFEFDFVGFSKAMKAQTKLSAYGQKNNGKPKGHIK